jgi:ribosomal protein S18 acetylase RimI-like enzyme
MCDCQREPLKFSGIKGVKVLGPKVSNSGSPKMRDADSDGKCQEEDGKWIPCPPGVNSGSVVSAAGNAVGKIGETIGEMADVPEKDREKQKNNISDILDEDGQIKPEVLDAVVSEARKKAADKAEIILKDAEENVTPEQKRAVRNIDFETLFMLLEDQENDFSDYAYNWNYDNPEPSQEDFLSETGDLDEEAYRDAVTDWENELENVKEQMRAEISNQEYLIGEKLTEGMSHTIVGRDGKTYKAVVTDTGGDYDGFKIAGMLTDEEGRIIGSFTRTFKRGEDGQLEVHHDYLRVDRQYQKAGIASALNARNEQLYREMGVDYITTNGVSSSGGFKGATHWPKNGFDWDSEYDRRRMISSIRYAPESFFESPEQRAIIMELVDAAESQSFYDTDRLTAADLLNWEGVEKWFQDQGLSLNFRRTL